MDGGGGGGKGKGRADDGSAEARRGRSGMDCSGGGRLAEGSGRWVARAAGVQEMGLAGRAAVSGRRLTKTRERAMGEGSEDEWELNASTIGNGARARSEEGRASASIFG